MTVSNEELTEGNVAKADQAGLVGKRAPRPHRLPILQVYSVQVHRLWKNTGCSLLIKKQT